MDPYDYCKVENVGNPFKLFSHKQITKKKLFFIKNYYLNCSVRQLSCYRRNQT